MKVSVMKETAIALHVAVLIIIIYADSLCMVQGPVALHKQSFIVKVRSQIKAGPLFEKLACFIISHYGLILSFFLLFLIPKIDIIPNLLFD